MIGWHLVLLLLVPVRGQVPLSVGFTEEPESTVALKGDSVFLHCKTNNEEANSKLRWLHNDTLISQANKDYEVRGGTLSFSLDSAEDSKLGDYRCVSEVSQMFQVSKSARVSLAFMDDFLPDKPETLDIFEGNDVIIDCQVPKSNPPAFVQFYKMDQVVKEDVSHQLLNGEVLLIANASQANSGRYTCSASNHITNEKKMSPNHIQLNVQPTDQLEKSRLTFRPEEKYEVLQGENLTIPCVASGNPKPEIVWTRLGGNDQVVSSPVQAVDGFLQIVNAQETDSGSYMCAIFNGSRRFLRRTTVDVLLPPTFTTKPVIDKSNGTIDEGHDLSLHCQGSGVPSPDIRWYVNGMRVKGEGHRAVAANGTLRIPFMRKEDEGIYQCFIISPIASSVTSIMIRVKSNDSISDEDLNLWHQPDLLDHLPMVPPSKPSVSQSSADSALITWEVPTTDASLTGETMPIQFFKIQFRELRKGTRSEWRTLDEELNARSRAFEIMGLKTGVRYRFRVVAVFANNDNLSGPLSDRFRLSRRFATDDKSDQPPSTAPILTSILPLSPTSLRIGWRMPSVTSDSIEGYFIYIRPVNQTHEEEPFKKVTIIGHASHTYAFEDLEQNTGYEIMVQAFNFHGSSPQSKVMRQKTLRSTVLEEIDTKANHNRTQVKNDLQKRDSDLVDDGQVTLYLILAAALVGAVLVLVICCSVAGCVRRNRSRKQFSNTKLAIHEKYLDTSRQISLRQSQQTLQPTPSHSHHAPYLHSDQQLYASNSHTAETSFSSPNRLSQVMNRSNIGSSSLATLQDMVNRNPNLTEDSGSELNASYAEATSLGYEEYTDEPSRTSWKRRRKSEEFV